MSSSQTIQTLLSTTTVSPPSPSSTTAIQVSIQSISSSSSTPTCATNLCQLDAFATQLVFPFVVVTETIYATTIGVTVLVFESGTFTETTTSTATTVAPPESSQTLTWTFSGVVLYVFKFFSLDQMALLLCFRATPS